MCASVQCLVDTSSPLLLLDFFLLAQWSRLASVVDRYITTISTQISMHVNVV